MIESPPLEALLRPPIEWLSTLVCLISALLIITWPAYFTLGLGAARVACGLYSALALWRFWQGVRIWRYQRRLVQRPLYTLDSVDVPISKTRLFLGRGFRWEPIHTQRLRDLDDPNYHGYRANNRYAPLGGEPALHGVSFTEAPIFMPLADRSGHTLVLGTTGVGKTRFAELLISQDIRRGDVVIVIDPKGDVDLLRRMVISARQAGRLSDLRVLHLGFPDYSIPYNPIGQFSRISEVATRITNQLPSGGDSDAFKAFAWQFIHAIATALHTLGETPTYARIQYYLTRRAELLTTFLTNYLPRHDPEALAWVKHYQETHLSKHGNPPTYDNALIAYVEAHDIKTHPVVDGLLIASAYETNYYEKITASVYPLLKKLTTQYLQALLSPQAEQTPLTWEDVIRHKQIVYVGLDALTDGVVATAVGNAMLSDLVSLAGRLYKFGLGEADKKIPLPRVCLHADEFNDIIGDEFIPLLNKARGVGFQVTAYTQTLSDVEARLGNAAKAGQVIGNLNTLIVFRVKEPRTAALLLDGLPYVPFKRAVPSTSAQDAGSGFRSSNEDRLSVTPLPMLTVNDLLNLPKGQAFALLGGGTLYKLRLPYLTDQDDPSPQDTEGLLRWLHPLH